MGQGLKTTPKVEESFGKVLIFRMYK